jgi:hypothetical protein
MLPRGQGRRHVEAGVEEESLERGGDVNDGADTRTTLLLVTRARETRDRLSARTRT